MPTLPHDLATAADNAGIRIDAVLQQTGKTLLAAGSVAGRRVAVKCLLGSDPFWAGKWRHELGVYEVFAHTAPPVRVPRLIYTDNTRLMALEWMNGQRLDDDRYPQRSLTDTEIDAVLATVEALNRWQPPAGAFDMIFDYRDRIGRYHAHGYLTDTDRDALLRLVDRAGAADQLNHGDPLASNILLRDTTPAVLLDWEFTGLFLPGFDLAMLHTQLGAATPALRTRIDTAVTAAGIEEPFVVNLATVLTRELRIHRQLPDGPLRETRLPVIDTAWQHTRERLHTSAIRSS
ncbi:phosphotransferase [Nocardia amamiensis]|uniref:phosphotransferase n=1 Tax=Nocardia amamiensis TaxID=404578 RepID=UPI000A036184|nr:phosphotransferase [Nocardia amamiensis]